jgi:quinolinate synthase
MNDIALDSLSAQDLYIEKIDPRTDLIGEIERLRREMNAVILAHYYQEGEIQDLADFVGDSLELSRKAAATKADVIVFAGVHFMAETAKILSPSKLVLMPDKNAGCSLADSCPAPLFKKWRDAHPGAVSITYINCSAEVKALSDIICTSSNAAKIISQIPADQEILFAPDRNLGAYLKRLTGRANMHIWEGSCIVHETFSEKKLLALQLRHPDAELIAHPECEDVILKKAAYIGSTSGLLRYAKESPKNKFIVATESGILHQMQRACPEKQFIAAPPDDASCSCNECPYMRLHTLEKLYLCMRDRQPAIDVPEPIRSQALVSIERMMRMS